MKRYLLPLLLASCFQSNIYAEDLETLLDIYAKESDLSVETKKEAAGNVIVYTRQDLEKMQVKSISELLKNIPFIRYNENRLGYTDLSYGKGRVTTSSDARVYINERELISPFYGNALGIISKFDIAYVDHVEIYYGVTSFEFGVEPSNMVVKLYTKDPNRENGGEIKTSYSSHNSNEINLSYGSVFEEYSLYTYIDSKTTNEKKILHEGTNLSRDKESLHLFLSLQNENNRLEYNRIQAKSDFFSAGLGGGDGSPNLNETDVTYNLLGWYSTWLEDKLSLSLDYIYLESKTKQGDDEPLGLLPPFNVPYNSFFNESHENQLSAIVKYREEIKNHNILAGLQFRDKSFKSKKTQVDNTIIPNTRTYNSEKIYGLFLEDNYLINDNNLIVAAAKYDSVKPNANLNDQELFLYRLGYIYKEDDFKVKAFYTSSQKKFDPNFYYNLTFTTLTDLEKQEDNKISLELNWDKYPYTYGIYLFNLKQENKLYLDRNTSSYKNSSKDYETNGISLTYSYNFDKLNRIDANLFIMKEENDQSNYNNTVHGGYVRLLNSVGKFDIYNELIYRNGYENLSAGYDYSAAVTYKHTNDLRFSLKGENILNNALETIYTETDPLNGTNTIGPFSTTTKRFWATMEYRF